MLRQYSAKELADKSQTFYSLMGMTLCALGSSFFFIVVGVSKAVDVRRNIGIDVATTVLMLIALNLWWLFVAGMFSF